jgi:cellulose biosynthesis protein BcsQ
LWDSRDRGSHRLTWDVFDRIGRLEGSLERKAESVYLAFDEIQQAACQWILLRLAQPGHGTDDIKCRVERAHLLGSEAFGAGTVAHVLDTLSSTHARLIVMSRDDAHGEVVVEVAHEALLRYWPRLRGWLDASRQERLARSLLTERAREWEIHGRDECRLFRGTQLSAALAWATRHEKELSTLERTFLEESHKAAQQQENLLALATRVRELEEKGKEAAQKARELEQKAVRLDWRMRLVAQNAGRIWETPVKTSLPVFFRRTGPQGRHVCIISLMNLKGGVGKSTIGANLGATLWRQFDRRVLLVDLDFQAVLTSLCLPHEEIDSLRRDAAFVRRLFHRKPADFEAIYPCLRRIRKEANCKCELLACDEAFSALEQELMMQWILGETDDDIRYRLRSLCHSEAMSQRYDYIILGCPPRETTASINALAASDYVLIPVLLDQSSAEAVPLMLSTLQRLKSNTEVPICPALQVMGIVANRVLQDGRLTPDEQLTWNWLKQACKDYWDTHVEQFERSIPDRIDFARAAGRNELAVLQSSEIQRVFIDLAKRVDAIAFSSSKTSPLP